MKELTFVVLIADDDVINNEKLKNNNEFQNYERKQNQYLMTLNVIQCQAIMNDLKLKKKPETRKKKGNNEFISTLVVNDLTCNCELIECIISMLVVYVNSNLLY